MDRYFQYQKEVAKAKLRIIERLEKGEKRRPGKRTSKTMIAWRILLDAGRPLHVSEIIGRAKSDFQVDLKRDSIVSAIIKKVNAGKMFVRTAPNTFAAKPEHTE